MASELGAQVPTTPAAPLSADTADAFWQKFSVESSACQGRLAELAVEDIGDMKLRLLKLQGFATESTSVLPSYDIKRAQEALEDLGVLLRAREEQLKPKKKFRFKSREKVRAAAVAAATARALRNAGNSNSLMGGVNGSDTSASALSAAAAAAASSSSSGDTAYSVSNRHGKSRRGGVAAAAAAAATGEVANANDDDGDVVILTADIIGEVNGVIRSLIISGCSGLTIVARCVLGSVRIENCQDCRIFLGPCRTSSYLDMLHSCMVFTSSHQLRIHKCHSCQLYVRVNSHPIIEDCTGMGFAPYAVHYPALQKHFEQADLSSAQCWDNVVDFRWHRSTQSPNWHVMAPPQPQPQQQQSGAFAGASSVAIVPIRQGVDAESGEATVWGWGASSLWTARTAPTEGAEGAAGGGGGQSRAALPDATAGPGSSIFRVMGASLPAPVAAAPVAVAAASTAAAEEEEDEL